MCSPFHPEDLCSPFLHTWNGEIKRRWKLDCVQYSAVVESFEDVVVIRYFLFYFALLFETGAPCCHSCPGTNSVDQVVPRSHRDLPSS